MIGCYKISLADFRFFGFFSNMHRSSFPIFSLQTYLSIFISEDKIPFTYAYLFPTKGNFPWISSYRLTPKDQISDSQVNFLHRKRSTRFWQVLEAYMRLYRPFWNYHPERTLLNWNQQSLWFPSLITIYWRASNLDGQFCFDGDGQVQGKFEKSNKTVNLNSAFCNFSKLALSPHIPKVSQMMKTHSFGSHIFWQCLDDRQLGGHWFHQTDSPYFLWKEVQSKRDGRFTDLQA